MSGPIEYLDIVDDNDNVIGSDTREQVHLRYSIHRGVHVVVQNSEGELLLQRRSIFKDYYPGFTDVSVGGQVLSGESYEEAAKRELYEELGCRHGPLHYLADYDAFSDRQREKRRIFVHHCNGPFILNKAETAALNWASGASLVHRLAQPDVTEGCRRTFAIFTRLAKIL